MRSLWVAALLAVAGCKGAVSMPAVAAAPAKVAAVAVAVADAGAAAVAYHEVAELEAMGVKSSVVDKQTKVLCGDANNKPNCVCKGWLPCSVNGKGCITFDENIKGFLAALEKPAPGSSVDCRRAEIGRCGAFRYFHFDGDVERRETRWFDDSGRMVAQRNSTDYMAYCSGRARKWLQGRIPRCEVMKREKLLCGKAEGPLPTIVDEILLRAPKAQ